MEGCRMVHRIDGRVGEPGSGSGCRSVLTWVRRRRELPVNGHKETLSGDGNILYLDCDGGYLGDIYIYIYACQNSLYTLNECSLLIVNYISG